MLTCRRSAQARKNAMAPTARSAPLEKIERLAETRERQIPCSVWASAWAPKTKKMRLLEIRRAHPLNHRESLVHTFAYQTVLFKITSDRSCCRAETPRAHPEISIQCTNSDGRILHEPYLTVTLGVPDCCRAVLDRTEMMQKRMLSNARLSWRSSLSAVRTRLHRRGSAAARTGDGAQEEKRPHASDMWKSSASGILLAPRGIKPE